MSSRSLIRRMPWMHLGEMGVIAWSMGLVISGHMLPSGSVAAQESSLPVLAVPSDTGAATQDTAVEAVPTVVPVVADVASAVPMEQKLPVIQPGIVSTALPREETKYQFDNWTVTVRPARKVAAPPQGPNNSVAQLLQLPLGSNNGTQTLPLMGPASAYNSPWWQQAMSPYLFQSPQTYWRLRGDQPFWQLREDFYHLRPFIDW